MKNKVLKRIYSVVAGVALMSTLLFMPVQASDASGIVSNGFGIIYSIIAAIVSGIGLLYLLWGIFEWATALNSQDGMAQSMAFKRIAAGLVAGLGPQLVPLIQTAFT